MQGQGGILPQKDLDTFLIRWRWFIRTESIESAELCAMGACEQKKTKTKKEPLAQVVPLVCVYDCLKLFLSHMSNGVTV